MTPAARIAAAIEILADFNALDTPIDVILKRWFKGHRFAGSKDRRAIRERVYQMVRHRGELVHAVGNDNPRLQAAAGLLKLDAMSLDEVRQLFGADKYGPDALDDDEQLRLARIQSDKDPVPASALANYPQWLESQLQKAFGDRIQEEMSALVGRAPVDLRVNTLKMSRSDASRGLLDIGVANIETTNSPTGLRLSESVSLEASDLYRSGCIEIQDEGSQIAARLTAAKPGMTCVDLCAGAGGKTLALAADMKGQGTIHCFDVSRKRLDPLVERARRAGFGDFECHVLGEASARLALDNLAGKADRVLVDAPCSGTGTWRRAPDAKWLLTRENLDSYRSAQHDVLRAAAPLVRTGGRIVYVTCSILPSENDAQVEAFLAEDDRFRLLDWKQVWSAQLRHIGDDLNLATKFGALLTPLRSQTDGFYISILERH